MLLANPHFPWEGEKRLWESHLTLTTGELDVYGATLSGVPGVLIGFNDAVAWTHTVSAGHRFTLYELTLTPGDPTTYVYGDETRTMTSEDIIVEVLRDDGTVEQVSRTMWESHYGVMLNLPFGWTAETAYTMRDANLDNTDILQQFFGMNMATSMDEFIDAHATANGIPWVNTIATSADGRAWYADASAAPNLSEEALAAWQARVDAGGTSKLALDNGAILLDGSHPLYEWVDDPEATRPGILAFSAQPQLERADFVFNANDSHWLAHPDELLTGYSRMTGREAYPQSARTRMNVVLLTDPDVRGNDDVLSLDELTGAILSQRSLHAELLLADVLTLCEGATTVTVEDSSEYDITGPCRVLAEWDGTYTTDAVGAALWREFLAVFGSAARIDAGPLYSVPFDPADPVGTPNTLNVDNASTILLHIGLAAKALDDAGWGYDVVLGEMQFDGRPHDEIIPIPGGFGLEGVASVVSCCSNPNTLGPKAESSPFVTDDFFIRETGYPITSGNSFMMTLQFTDDGPIAQGVLTYGQPDDIESEDFTSQTKLYSDGEFRPMWFTEDEIEADEVSTMQVVGNL